MGIPRGPPLTTMMITLLGSGCAIPLQSMTTNRAAGGRDMVPGLVRRMQATMNVISRGDGVADHQEAWTLGTEWKNVDYGRQMQKLTLLAPVLTYGFSFFYS